MNITQSSPSFELVSHDSPLPLDKGTVTFLIGRTGCGMSRLLAKKAADALARGEAVYIIDMGSNYAELAKLIKEAKERDAMTKELRATGEEPLLNAK